MKKIFIICFLFVSCTAFSQDSFEILFLKKVNEFRKENGLTSVEYSSILDSACTLHSTWMWDNDTLTHRQCRTKGADQYYYSHMDRIEKYDTAKVFDARLVGENVCSSKCDRGKQFGFTQATDAIVTEMVDSWVNSPGHRAALLKADATHAAFSIVASCKPETGTFCAYSTCLLAKKVK